MFEKTWLHVTHKKKIFILHFLYFCKTLFGKKKIIFLEMKTTQKKPKGCLLNTPLNQINLIKNNSKSNKA
jgi:hypothetical protein